MSYIIDRMCCGKRGTKDTRCARIWSVVLAVHTWRRLLLYLILSVPTFLDAMRATATLACGVLINLIGLVHFLGLFREKNHKNPVKYRQLGIY